MQVENQALALRDEAANQLAQIKDIETGTKYLNEVTAIETWAKAEKKDAILQNLIAEQKLRTQRILGNLIKQGQQAGEVASQKSNRRYDIINEGNYIQKPKTLADLGLTPHQSMNFQTISNMPEDKFEEELAKAKEESDKRVELTTSRVVAAAKRMAKVKQETGPSDPIYNEVDRLLLKVGDKLQYIIQGDYTPTTASDFRAIDAIRHHMYRFVRMAGQMGIDMQMVWEKTANRHGIKNELPDHLQDKENLYTPNKNSDMDDAEIIE
jgi:hypothetical protein